jgi:hypothetical protein
VAATADFARLITLGKAGYLDSTMPTLSLGAIEVKFEVTATCGVVFAAGRSPDAFFLHRHVPSSLDDFWTNFYSARYTLTERNYFRVFLLSQLNKIF